MKIAVIDIGSNSVRLLTWADGKTLYKRTCTTRLGEGLNASPYLKQEAVDRTAQAVSAFVEEAKRDGAEMVCAFATAAVRSSKNPQVFTDKVRALCGIEVDVISGEREAEIGLAGALRQGDGGIIDVGGASTEVTVRTNGRVVYSKSVNIGTVRILDCAGRDLNRIENFVASKIEEYGSVDFSSVNMYAVGGTATRLASIKHGLKVYTPEISGGTVLSQDEIHELANKLTAMPVEQIRKQTICSSSADLIGGGAMLTYMIMKKLGVKSITVSESDNLEGYVYSVSGSGKGGNE